MFGKKVSSPQIDNAVSKAVNFEITLADMARRSERRAWFVASGAIVLSLMLAAGYFYMLPLKEKVPYLIMADAYTGTSSVARLTEDSDHRSITTKEAVNRSNVAHFLLARESYDVALMNLRDRTTVYTMSSPDVAAGYTNLHNPKSPTSPFNVYGKNKAIRVNILSISLIGGSAKVESKGATVRFQRSLYDKPSGTSKPLDSNIATMEFTYKSNLKMEEKYRIENPLGFQVTNYRVDRDYDDSWTSPPRRRRKRKRSRCRGAQSGAACRGTGRIRRQYPPRPPIPASQPAIPRPPARRRPAAPHSNNANGAINQ